MQTYSQTVDPALSATDLPGLAARLALPVTQDDLANSYSLQA
jgi:hypothetical protein